MHLKADYGEINRISLQSSMLSEGPFNYSLLSTEETDRIYLTIKNYKMKNGLSRRFSDKNTCNDIFEIKGPMGKGLGITKESKGTHYAFSAGTGILAFIDLVARIALGELDIIG